MAEAEVPVRLVRLRAGLSWVVLAQVTLLAATGAALAYGYQPTHAQAWAGIAHDSGPEGPTLHTAIRTAHRWLAWSAVLPTLALAAVALSEAMVRWQGPMRRRSGAVAGPATAVGVIVALATGFFLPWDQLALRSVTVGSTYRGYGWLLGDDVRFVLVDGVEVSVAAVRALFAVHAIVVPAAVVLALVTLVRRRRRSPVPMWAPPPPPSSRSSGWQGSSGS